jgi:hypothetical protein
MLFNQHVVTCDKMIRRIFLGSFTHKMGIITPIFNNKNEVVQVVNSNMRLLKIYDNINDNENSVELNQWFGLLCWVLDEPKITRAKIALMCDPHHHKNIVFPLVTLQLKWLKIKYILKIWLMMFNLTKIKIRYVFSILKTSDLVKIDIIVLGMCCMWHSHGII